MTQITLYTAATPNGHKISVTLEELGLDYKAYEVDLQKAEQKEQWFLKINPNGRIPAIGKPVEKTEAGGWKVWSSVVDHGNGDLPVFESGAIMIYLAERYGNGNLLPKEDQARYEVIEWLMFQMGGLGPMMGQASWFINYAPVTVPYAQKRYYDESRRLFTVLESRLQGREYLAGDSYSLADIANVCWPIFASYVAIDIDDFPSVKEWTHRCYAREATRKGFSVPKKFSGGMITNRQREESCYVRAFRSMRIWTTTRGSKGWQLSWPNWQGWSNSDGSTTQTGHAFEMLRSWGVMK